MGDTPPQRNRSGSSSYIEFKFPIRRIRIAYDHAVWRVARSISEQYVSDVLINIDCRYGLKRRYVNFNDGRPPLVALPQSRFKLIDTRNGYAVEIPCSSAFEPSVVNDHNCFFHLKSSQVERR